MTIYARIQDGVVAEIIQPLMDQEGNEYPIAERFVPALVETMVDVTSQNPMPDQGWSYDGHAFTQPAPPPETAESSGASGNSSA